MQGRFRRVMLQQSSVARPARRVAGRLLGKAGVLCHNLMHKNWHAGRRHWTTGLQLIRGRSFDV
jgi:hypothetical protein